MRAYLLVINLVRTAWVEWVERKGERKRVSGFCLWHGMHIIALVYGGNGYLYWVGKIKGGGVVKCVQIVRLPWLPRFVLWIEPNPKDLHEYT